MTILFDTATLLFIMKNDLLSVGLDDCHYICILIAALIWTIHFLWLFCWMCAIILWHSCFKLNFYHFTVMLFSFYSFYIYFYFVSLGFKEGFRLKFCFGAHWYASISPTLLIVIECVGCQLGLWCFVSTGLFSSPDWCSCQSGLIQQ